MKFIMIEKITKLAMDNKTVTLFQNLAVRLRNENDLSDVTWAMCQTSSEFMKVFLTFIFGADKIMFDSPITDFMREYSIGNIRPDFYFKYKGKKYIIEVKIYDEGHHFVDYQKHFNVNRIGYIANYNMKSPTGFDVKTWEGFYNHLIKHNWDEEYKIIIDAYCEYLKSVCNIIKIDHMKFENLKSLNDFNLAIERIFPNNGDAYTSKLYRKHVGEAYSGAYFEFKWAEKIAWGWFGILYTTSEIVIEFNSDSNYGAEVFDLLKKNDKSFISLSNEFILKTEFSGNKYYFILNKDMFEAIVDSTQQIDFLRSFNIYYH